MVYIYSDSKLLRERPNANPTTWYKKDMVSKNSMFDVDESVDENDSLNEHWMRTP
jgi:hypothetical protein